MWIDVSIKLILVTWSQGFFVVFFSFQCLFPLCGVNGGKVTTIEGIGKWVTKKVVSLVTQLHCLSCTLSVAQL